MKSGELIDMMLIGVLVIGIGFILYEFLFKKPNVTATANTASIAAGGAPVNTASIFAGAVAPILTNPIAPDGQATDANGKTAFQVGWSPNQVIPTGGNAPGNYATINPDGTLHIATGQNIPFPKFSGAPQGVRFLDPEDANNSGTNVLGMYAEVWCQYYGNGFGFGATDYANRMSTLTSFGGCGITPLPTGIGAGASASNSSASNTSQDLQDGLKIAAAIIPLL